MLEGRLAFRTPDPASAEVLTPQAPGLIRPEHLHEVEPLGPVRFYVEFHASPAGT